MLVQAKDNTDANTTALQPSFCLIVKFCQKLASPHILSGFPLIKPTHERVPRSRNKL